MNNFFNVERKIINIVLFNNNVKTLKFEMDIYQPIFISLSPACLLLLFQMFRYLLSH